MDVVYYIIKERVSMKSLSFDKRVEQPRIMLGVATATIPNQKRWMELAALLIMFACFFITSNAVAQSLTFADKSVERRALLKGDTDNDGHISKAEADSLKSLVLTQYRTDMFEVSTYEDLAKFPNLEKLWLGESKLDTVDLSKNWNLKYVHIECDNLKTLILAVGCTPKLAYPMHSGEVLIKRIKNPDAPGAMFFQY